MKRKGRKSTNKKSEVDENGADESGTENGDATNSDGEPEPQKKKTPSKRKALEANGGTDGESPKKRASRGKAVATKTNSDDDNSEVEEAPKKRESRGKAVTSKTTSDDDDNTEMEEGDPKGKKGKKKKVSEVPKKKTSKTKAPTPPPKDKEEDKEELESEDEQDYEVEEIIDMKIIGGNKHYLIRWKGYGKDSDSWEAANTLNCPELIATFNAKNKNKKKKPKKKATAESSETWDENEDFEVDKILEVHFRKDGSREFLVSWKGYPHSQNSWEPEDNMDCKDLIKKFMEKVEKARDVGARELRVYRPQTDRLTLVMHTGTGRRTSKRQNGLQRVHYHDAE